MPTLTDDPPMSDTLSYCRGTVSTPLVDDTIAGWFDRTATAYRDRDALVACADHVRYTYGELHREVERAASGLLALGVVRGDRVVVCAGNSAEWVIAQFACAKVGAILAAMNPALDGAELDRAFRQVGARLLVAARRHMGRDLVHVLGEHVAPSAAAATDVGRNAEAMRTVFLGSGPVPEWAVTWTEMLHRGDRIRRAALARAQASTRCNQPALLLFTSGTTGEAKAAVVTHYSVVNSGFFIGERLGYTPADRVCVPIPMFHSIGCIAGTIAVMTHGCGLVLPGPSFDPQACLAAVDDERCTSLYGVPSMFVAQFQHPAHARSRLQSLRTGIVAGAPCSSDTMRQVIARMHIPELTTCYGLTEARCLFQSLRDDPLERRASNVGVVHPHVECKVVDIATGRIARRGVSGELCARGYGVMSGYWNDDEASGRVIDADGWFHTGDMATMDEDAYLTIVGRLKDTICRGGENVSASEIEELLRRCPDVLDACVVGVPDADYGEEACAWVRVRDGQAVTDRELRRFCRERAARHKIPRHILVIERFPVTATGKVQKYRLREWAIQRLSAATPLGSVRPKGRLA